MQTAARIRAIVAAGLAFATAGPAAAAAAPDPLLGEQWALSAPAATGAQEAWTQSTGRGVLVAVLDSGIQLDHPDLAANIWTNPGEVPANGIDDDGDGFVDDVHGANMFDHSGDLTDNIGHGTHIAGILAARRDNGIGGSGMAPDATILPVKILDGPGGTTKALADGILYAVDRGARILNVSLSSDTPTEDVAAAVSYAGAHGAIVVACAGNLGLSIDAQPVFPAALPDPAVVSVAAATSENSLWAGSNVGPVSVDLAAPGDQILSTAPGSSFQWRSGTSTAAPFVAGTLALLSAARPDLPMSTLRDVTLATIRRSAELDVVRGRLDAAAAMHHLLPGPAWRQTVVRTPAIAPRLVLRARRVVRAGTRMGLRWSARRGDRVWRSRVLLDGRLVRWVAGRSGAVSRVVGRSGRHTWRVVGVDAHGANVVSAQRTFYVVARRARWGFRTGP